MCVTLLKFTEYHRDIVLYSVSFSPAPLVLATNRYFLGPFFFDWDVGLPCDTVGNCGNFSRENLVRSPWRCCPQGGGIWFSRAQAVPTGGAVRKVPN